MASSATATTALGSTVTTAMQAVADQLSPQMVIDDVKAFALADSKVGHAQDIMNEALNMDEEGLEIDEESNVVVQQLLQEVGLEVAAAAPAARVGAVAVPPQRRRNEGERNGREEEEEERLDRHLAALKGA